MRQKWYEIFKDAAEPLKFNVPWDVIVFLWFFRKSWTVPRHISTLIGHLPNFIVWNGCFSDSCGEAGEGVLWTEWDPMIKKNYTAMKRASCSKSAAGLLPCCHQADIRMRSHRLLRLDDDKFVVSCQQAWCKLIVKTFYPQASCKLFQQLAASLQISSCNKSDFHRLAEYITCWVRIMIKTEHILLDYIGIEGTRFSSEISHTWTDLTA